MTKPPRFQVKVDYEELQAKYAQNSNVIEFAEERSRCLVTSVQFIEFLTSDIKVASVFSLTFTDRDPIDILWWLQVGDTLYLLRPNVP
jgi:hypothetical protein